MRNLILGTILLFGLSFSTVKAEDVSKKIESLRTEISALKNKQEHLNKEIDVLLSKNAKVEGQIADIQAVNKKLVSNIDSLQKYTLSLHIMQKTDRFEFTNSIGQTNKKVKTTDDVLSSLTLCGVCGLIALLIAIIATVFVFLKKFKLGASSIDNVRKAQEALQIAQTKMQEEALSLDNKLIEIAEKQIEASSTSEGKNEIDHSLVLKVADEIVRIELNMSRMDSSIKGYKQLAKAVERIKDNFSAKGYEIVDMLGKTYTAGIKAAVTFVTDENLEEGQQVITKIIKPQINYQGKMIQSAQIEVSQSE